MAWRVGKQVIRGEIDNRVRGRVTGRIWFVGSESPVILDLRGNPWRDLAGYLSSFSNPNSEAGKIEGLSPVQEGVVGDMTASRKVKVPECSMEELIEHYKTKTPFPWHWGNSLYIEWFSERNGRVVIESAEYKLKLAGGPEWTMSEKDEREQFKENRRALADFMGQVTGGVMGGDLSGADPAEYEEEPPESEAEAREDDDEAD